MGGVEPGNDEATIVFEPRVQMRIEILLIKRCRVILLSPSSSMIVRLDRLANTLHSSGVGPGMSAAQSGWDGVKQFPAHGGHGEFSGLFAVVYSIGSMPTIAAGEYDGVVAAGPKHVRICRPVIGKFSKPALFQRELE
jgi:hypothetical protein